MIGFAVSAGDVGQVLAGIGTVVLAIAAIPAVLGIRRARRVEAARWTEGLFRDLYLSERFARRLLAQQKGFGLYAVDSPTVFQSLDKLVGYDAGDPTGSTTTRCLSQ